MARSRIAIGICLSAGIWFFTPVAPPHFFELVFSTAAAARVWQLFCVGGFLSGAVLVGTAWTKGRVERGRVFLEDEVTGLIAPRDATIQQLTEANSQWERAFQTAIAERDDIKNRYLQALNDSDNERTRYRKQTEEMKRLVSQERDRLTAENAELRRSMAQMCALPEKFMKVLKQVVAHSLVVKAVRIALAPERAKDGDPRQHMLRTEMIQKFIELIDYVQSH